MYVQKKRCIEDFEELVRSNKLRIVDEGDDAYGHQLMETWMKQQAQVPSRDKVTAVWRGVVRGVRKASQAPGGPVEGQDGGMDSDVGGGHEFAPTGGGGRGRGRGGGRGAGQGTGRGVGRGAGRGTGQGTGRQPEQGPGLGPAPVGNGAGGMSGTPGFGSAQGMVWWELGLGLMEQLLSQQPVPADQVRATMVSLASAYGMEGVKGKPSVDEKWKEINERVGLLPGG